MQAGFQGIQLSRSTVGVDLHFPIRQVPCPAGDAQIASGFPGEGAEADSLYAPCDPEDFGRGSLHRKRFYRND